MNITNIWRKLSASRFLHLWTKSEKWKTIYVWIWKTAWMHEFSIDTTVFCRYSLQAEGKPSSLNDILSTLHLMLPNLKSLIAGCDCSISEMQHSLDSSYGKGAVNLLSSTMSWDGAKVLEFVRKLNLPYKVWMYSSVLKSEVKLGLVWKTDRWTSLIHHTWVITYSIIVI